MKAVVFKQHGPTSVLQYVADWPIPEPKNGEVLVKQKATGVNPIDTALRAGIGILNVVTKMPKVPGGDICGTIERFGLDTKSDFAVGDWVFGLSGSYGPLSTNGTYAEFAVTKVSELARLPEGLSPTEAAGIPLPGLTAWQAVEKANLQAGQRIFIAAGSGGVGGHAIQFAKAKGLHVTTSCSTKNADYVRQLGADEVFDYTQGKKLCDVYQADPFDAVIESRGGKEQYPGYQSVKPTGTFVAIMGFGYIRDYGALGNLVEYSVIAKWKLKHWLGWGPAFESIYVQPSGTQMKGIADLYATGKLKVLPTEVLPLKDARIAHDKVESHHTRGKIVLEISA